MHEQLNSDRLLFHRLQAEVGLADAELIITSIILHEQELEQEREREREQELEQERAAELREQLDIDQAFLDEMQADLDQVQAELSITSAIIHEQEHIDREHERERRWLARFYNIKKIQIDGWRHYKRIIFFSTLLVPMPECIGYSIG